MNVGRVEELGRRPAVHAADATAFVVVLAIVVEAH